MSSQIDLIIKMNITAWEMQNKIFSELVEKLTDKQLMNETSPGRNTGVYLIGHIAAASDDIFRLFGLREKMFPDYLDIFIKSRDKSGKTFPSIAELKSAHSAVTKELNDHFTKLTPEDWLSKHTAISDEDFAKEPMRNKLNVLISRTNHLSYHIGQMIFLGK